MINTAFDKIIGYEDIKLELHRILDQLREPDRYAALGVTVTHGLLLYGEPGVGKSTFAKCFVEASGRNVFICRKDKPDGEFVKEISRVFEEAVKAAPAVVLLDDLDKFSNGDEQHRDSEEYVTVQTCIDQVRDTDVFVIATVNNVEKLPNSLTRAGRFDHVLEVECPEGKDAEAIVSYYLSRKTCVGELNVKRIARLLSGRSCAQLESVVNQAGVYAAYERRDKIENRDMIKAILRLVFDAPEKSDANVKYLPAVACHEAGHALAAELLEPDSVDLVTVVPHDSSMSGVVVYHRDEGYFFNKKLMENRVMCVLAGKAATEICYGVVDPGAARDLRRAFDIVQRFVDDYCTHGFDAFVYDREVSNELLARRDSKVAMDVESFYTRVRQLLTENRSKLEALTQRLLEEKTLLGDQVQELLKTA